MCGIAGIFNSKMSRSELRNLSATMIEQLHHRGPDGNGSTIRSMQSSGNHILLTHSRLSINDLSESGKQPMSDQSGAYWVTFNGEIYNFKEIREELAGGGIRFRSTSDTEVLIESYRRWGLDAFKKFIGMWAVAIWDANKQRLILSRDRLGIKPLYYFEHDQAVFFGSEPKVITRQVPESRKVNLEAISDYFSFRYPLGGEAFFEGVKSLEPGTHLILEAFKPPKQIRYWDLPVIRDKADVSEISALTEVASLLESSVNYRMISDVPVGSFLSGGLDSSLLVALMKECHPGAIRTFTTGFEDEGFNEFEFARMVADACGTEHREKLLGFDNYFESLDEMIYVKDAPLAVPNEIALHSLSKALKEHVTVVLSGEGADELFGGYGRIFRSAYDYQRVQGIGIGGLSPRLLSNLNAKYKSLSWDSEVEHFLGQYSYIDLNDKDKLLSERFSSESGVSLDRMDYFSSFWKRLDGLDLAEKHMWIFQKIHLPGLLGRLDSATMSASVEGRVPFVDHRLVEYVNALPLKYKMKWNSSEAREEAEALNSDQISETYDTTKYLMRQYAQKLLPSKILNRKKVGFPVPLKNWFSGPMKDHAEEILFSPNARSREMFDNKYVKELIENVDANSQNGMTIWMLINVERWMEQNSLSV